MDPHLTCTCMRMMPAELLQKWQARVMPIAARLVAHGYPLDSDKLDATVALIVKLETGVPECFSAENAHHSHHLPDCPWLLRNRLPKPSPEQAQATKLAVLQHRHDGLQLWATQYAAGVNRWFRNEPAGPGSATG